MIGDALSGLQKLLSEQTLTAAELQNTGVVPDLTDELLPESGACGYGGHEPVRP